MNVFGTRGALGTSAPDGAGVGVSVGWDAGRVTRHIHPLPTHLGRQALVVHGDVTEQIGHGLSVVDTADGLGEDHAHVHRLDLRTLELLHLMGHCVGHHHLGQHKSGHYIAKKSLQTITYKPDLLTRLMGKKLT